jgi:hypothetical protein
MIPRAWSFIRGSYGRRQRRTNSTRSIRAASSSESKSLIVRRKVNRPALQNRVEEADESPNVYVASFMMFLRAVLVLSCVLMLVCAVSYFFVPYCPKVAARLFVQNWESARNDKILREVTQSPTIDTAISYVDNWNYFTYLATIVKNETNNNHYNATMFDFLEDRKLLCDPTTRITVSETNVVCHVPQIMYTLNHPLAIRRWGESRGAASKFVIIPDDLSMIDNKFIFTYDVGYLSSGYTAAHIVRVGSADYGDLINTKRVPRQSIVTYEHRDLIPHWTSPLSKSKVTVIYTYDEGIIAIINGHVELSNADLWVR